VTFSALQILLGILEVPYTFHYPKDVTDWMRISGSYLCAIWGRFQNPYIFCRKKSWPIMFPYWIHQHTSCRLSSLNLPRNAMWIYIWEALYPLPHITLVSQSTLTSNLLQLTRRTRRRHKCQHVNSEGFGLGVWIPRFLQNQKLSGSKWHVFLFQSETICTLVGFFWS